MGPKGVEPSPNGLKVRHAASYTTAPMFSRGYAFQSQFRKHVGFSFVFVVVSGSPEDRTQRDPRIRRIWATSPRLPCCRFKKSDTSESNREPPGPKPGVLPSAPVSDVVCSSRRGRFRRRISSMLAGREALESSSAVLQTAARPSQLPAQIGFVVGVARSMRTRKKARCLGDTEPS